MGTNDTLHVGDFDADGRKDLVCRMNDGEAYQIALTDECIAPVSCGGE